MNLTRLYDPAKGKMRVVAFASGSGTNFDQAVLESKRPESNFSIDLLVTDKEFKKKSQVEGKKVIGAIEYAVNHGVEVRVVDGFAKCGSFKEARKSVEGMREYEQRCLEFNMDLLRAIQSYEQEKGFTFDFAVLAGYMRIFKGPILRRFNMSAINVHPARLDLLNENGFRKFVGENAVYDALAAGEKQTRSSIILVDPEMDAGAILVSGQTLPYVNNRFPSQEEADEHQSLQKKVSDWPSLRFSLRAIANGDFSYDRSNFHKDGNPVIYYRGKELPYEGLDLDKFSEGVML